MLVCIIVLRTKHFSEIKTSFDFYRILKLNPPYSCEFSFTSHSWYGDPTKFNDIHELLQQWFILVNFY